jgi:hypothetical protein
MVSGEARVAAVDDDVAGLAVVRRELVDDRVGRGRPP